MPEPLIQLSPRFDEAVALARELHLQQGRKGTPIPYIAHLLGVCSLVLEAGGDEDEAIAALLHDAVEDVPPAQATLSLIRDRFGSNVADIVWACTDADTEPKPPWRERKEAYLAHLSTASESALRVSLADKLHNARAIVFDLQAVGPSVWDRFKAGREGALWYYGELATAFEARGCGPMAVELRRTVELMREMAEG